MIPPKAYAGYDEWLEAFWELGTERQLGQVVGPIPASKIREYSVGMVPDERDLFYTVIRRLDAVYLGGVGKPAPTFTRDMLRSGT